MLSFENPSDPLVPCKASALKSDERASDKLVFQEAADPAGLAETQPSHFSIRDYVLNLRSKDVVKNWPFPCKFLQLCLEYDIKDMLPPFEPPDLVRAQFCTRRVESQQQSSYSEQISAEVKSLETKDVGRIEEEPNIIKHELCLPADQLVIECSNQAQNLFSKSMKSKVDHKIHSGDELVSVKAEPISTIMSHDQIERTSGKISELPCTVHVTRSAPAGSLALEAEEPPVLLEKLDVRRESSEKCKLIVKSSSTSETIQGEDIVSTSSTVSDPMASKVCPVCKMFASTSNTTLNAHIDQCLSEDFKTMRVMTKLPKLKVKPRKKRLMVDIYTTAPHCTIEDLDRRNGTNWATDLTLVAPTREVSTEVKRSKLSISGATDDGNEEAVYVDSNGTKLRILSFNNVPPVITKENIKLRKHVKGIKAGRSSLISQKECFKSKYSKCTKINQRNKRLRSFELFNGKTRVTQIGDCHSSTYEEKEESLSCILNDQDQAKGRGPGTLRQRVCSKCSGPSRKINKKGYDKSMENIVPSTLDTFVEGNQSNRADSSAVKSHILKLSRSSEDLLSSTKTKRVDVLSNSVHATYNGKTMPPKPLDSNSGLVSPQNISSDGGLMQKLTRSSRNFVSSSWRKREEIHSSIIRKSDNSPDVTIIPSGSCHPSLKTKKRLMPKDNVSLGKSSSLEVSKGDESEKRLTVWKFGRQRSILSTGKWREKSPSGINKGLHGSTEYFGFEYSPRVTETSNVDPPNFSENITIPSVLESERERDGFCTMAKQESNKKRLLLGADCYGFDVEASDMQHEPLDCEDIANEHSMDKAIDEHGGSENLIIQHLTSASSPRLDPWPSGQEHLEYFCGSEAPVEGGLIDKQVVLCRDVARIINKDIERVGEEGNLLRLMQSEDQTDTSIKRSSACLICHVDMVLESPEKSSSAASVRMTSNQDLNLAGGVEASASPSTSSNISLPSPEVPHSEDTNEEQCMKHNADQDNLSSSLSNNSELPSIVSIRGTEGMKKEKRDQKGKATAVAEEPEKLSDDQPCCCSHRESLSQESPQPLRQSIMTNSKIKQTVSNLCIRPTILSSSTSHGLRSGEVSAPILESLAESILTKTPAYLASKLPLGSDSGPPSLYSQAQSQASSNPLLRLMGKDLIVKKEELAKHFTVLPSDSDCASTMKSVPLGFTSTNNGSRKISFSYQQHQISSGSTIPSKASSKTQQHISRFVGVASMKSQQKRAKKLHTSLPCSIKRRAASQHRQISSAQAPNRDVTVIDDSPGIEAEPNRSISSPVVTSPPAFPGSNLIPPRPSSCFPPKNPYMSREVSGMIRRSSISYPKADAYIPVEHDSTSEGSVPCSSYMFRSPLTARLTPSLYYSRTLE
ncbi:uncharacterized protein LOC103710642 [Phoenix dactylifera]|uniref:Uncharacterized protein LOC103710642 n=1 Tax=Phoenix dactylifera TaxID=42345 RepID=A0A8B7C9R1_PHODC|nr:uncharacterized protein LOC103710642 [Phoenix dactylifera]XP_038983086.1 uncharacterized protein LOC103710642 [Phoenix dactylifera]